jgi:hypothetical protein
MKSKKLKAVAIIFISVIIALALGLPNMTFATPVPDTGQTKCYSNTIEIPCPQSGEPFYGQDANYSINPPSYTDLGNGVVQDNVTGLMWQQATAPGNYTWQQAIDYSNNLNLGGYNDWRLPTVKELLSIVDYSRSNPAIDTTYFPDTQAFRNYFYWSSTTPQSGGANAVHFSTGEVHAYYFDNFFGCYVRAVRGEQSNNNFIDNGNGTVTDTDTGLMWQQETAQGSYNWEQALACCEGLTLGGYNDWRLPTVKELLSIVDYSRYPAIYTTYFPDTVVDNYYLSSTTSRAATDGTAAAWLVTPDHGEVVGYYKSSYFRVRAVRGELGSSTTTTVCDADCWKALYEQCQAQINSATTTTAPPTNIELSVLDATPSDKQVILKWKTESEPDNAGFNVWRADNFVKINNALIPALGSSVTGSDYDFIDQWVLNGKRYFYLLEDIDTNGISTFHGPVKAVPRWIYGAGK